MPSKRKVLIIDDEIDLCLLLKSYFLRKDYDVYLSHTLGEGISFLKSIQPDIVFIDNNLPDGTGWNVAPQLASEFPKMYIVLISAFHPSVPQMPESSHYMILEKPISLSDLEKHFPELHLQSAK